LDDEWGLPFFMVSLPPGKTARDYDAPGVSEKKLWERLQITIVSKWTDFDGILYLVPASTLANWLELDNKPMDAYRYVRHVSLIMLFMSNHPSVDKHHFRFCKIHLEALILTNFRICTYNVSGENTEVFGSMKDYIRKCISRRKADLESKAGSSKLIN
jgi:hypothetical protein